MKTWKQSGLLDIVSEKLLILNDPSPEETTIALEFGFRIIEPKSVPGGKVSEIVNSNFTVCCFHPLFE
jgi:hypothetical protein